MALNPYQPSASSNIGFQREKKTIGSVCVTGLTVSLIPAINEASIFWGHTEWLFWDHPQMLPLGMKLWVIGMMVNLSLFGILNYARFNTRITWKMSAVVASIPVIVHYAMCLIGYLSLQYDMHVWAALILTQFASLAIFRSSIIGKALVGAACMSGFVIYLIHMMVSSLSR